MKNKLIYLCSLTILCFSVSLTSTTLLAAEPTQLIHQGNTYFQQGNFQQAVKHWEKSLPLLDDEKNVSQRIDVLIRLAAAYQALGMHQLVFEILNKALSLTEQTQDAVRSALALSQLSDAWLSLGEPKEAMSVADNSVADALEAQESGVLARALNSQANALAILGHYPQAINAYTESLQFAHQANDSALAVKVSINRLNTTLDASPLTEIMAAQDEAWQQIEKLPDNHAKATSLITMGVLGMNLLQEERIVKQKQQAARDLTHNDKSLTELDRQFLQELLQKQTLTKSERQKTILRANSAFKEAGQIGKSLQDVRTTSIAYGYWGQLYEIEQRYTEALTLTRQAIFFAKQDRFPHSLYRWYWQNGRIFKAQNKIDQAIAAYRLAGKTLKPIQRVLEIGYRRLPGTFNEMVKPVHYGLVDLLLKKAATIHDESAQQRIFKEAIAAAELVKVAELQDYFQDDCVLALQSKAVGLDQIAANTAILYPLPLADRLVVLTSVGGKISQSVIPADAEQVNETTWALRLGLQTRPNNRFLYQAQQLYDWIIRPIEPLLTSHKVDTLIVVPDGKLRMIPFSTLHDGKHFLVEKYALALTPGLTLLDPHPINWEGSNILLVGLSEAVQEYPPLSNVPKELRNIREITEGIAHSNSILNAQYSIDKFRSQIKGNEYSVIHLATHGEFDSDPEHTYLLTYDSKMTMDKLQNIIGLGRFRDKPLELLTLSACKTAVGDDRAALGLAGVAVKAGARSAIATLWFVDDEATSIAVADFYRQLLETPGLSKAKALQNVQKELIAQDRYWHPSYWAPFLLIGNWL